MIIDFQFVSLTLAVFFGFLMACGIGANDVSNAMGTSVGSKAITIKQAVIIAAIFEFLGAFIAGSEVTNTIKQSIIDINVIQDEKLLIITMLASLLASGIWLIAASVLGWPVSTTHTIVGAIMGVGLVKFGLHAITWHKVISIFIAWIFSPILGCVISYIIFISTQYFIFSKLNPFNHAKKSIPIYLFFTVLIIAAISVNPIKNLGINLTIWQKIIFILSISLLSSIVGKILIHKLHLEADKYTRKQQFDNVEKLFAILMIFTACAMAFAHGSNDVANAIGPVAAIVHLVGEVNYNVINEQNIVPIWVLFLGASGIIIGLATYGHKVIATVGSKITQLTPSRGFSATLAAAITVVLASNSGLPISTTHTLVGAILGVGMARGIDALNLNVIRSIILSWIVTLPMGALLAVILFYILHSLISIL